MATNLVSHVMQFLTPDMIARIAAALGLSREDVQGGLAAAVPALLAAISGAAAQPGGAQNMVDAIRQQSGVVDGFAGMIGGGKQPALIEKGSSLLTSVLGSNDQATLAAAIGKFTGLGADSSRSLLSMLTPVVMGLIGKQLGSSLDAGSLTGLLSSQKQQIAQALPAGIGNVLKGTGLLDGLSGAAGSATDAAGRMGRATSAAADETARYATLAAGSVETAGQRAARGSASLAGWAFWAIPLAAIAALAVYWLSGDRETQTAQQIPAVTQGVMVDGVDVGKQVGEGLNALQTSLQGITDAASARAALPKLQEATAQIDRVNGMIGQLPDDQQQNFATLTASSVNTIDRQCERVLAIPGAGEVVRPTIDNLKTKIAVLADRNTTVGVKR